MQLKVIDVSSWQHPNGAPIDWAKVAASGVQGVIIKATQGVWYTNPFFADDADQAHAAGLVVGAYHFAEPGRDTPEGQAAYFHGVCGGRPLALGVWLDLEQNGTLPDYELDGWAQAFMLAIDTPQAPAGLYVNLNYAGKVGGAIGQRPLWLANPSGTPNAYNPYIIQTGQAAVEGIEGAVDQDVIPNARGVNPPSGGGAPLPVPPPEPAPAPSQADHPVLSQSATGDAVRAAQEALNAHGAGLAVDGNFGPATHEAVEAFQVANGLVVDGIIGPQTWAALETPADHPVAAEPGHEPELSQGATGNAVVLLQRLLNQLGAGLTVDGDFGPLTREKVANFQQTHSLTADGIVGPVTWGALRNAT